jgi:hypothetical protein
MGLGRLTSNSITHMDLYKPNNKLVNAQLEHFGARTNHGQPRTNKTHHGSDLGEATTFPLMIYFVHGHKTSTQMSFCLRTPTWESGNSQSLDSHYFGIPTLGAHNFVCKPPIEVRFQAKL